MNTREEEKTIEYAVAKAATDIVDRVRSMKPEHAQAALEVANLFLELREPQEEGWAQFTIPTA